MGEVLDIQFTENGIIFAYCEKKDENSITVAFKMITFDNGKITNVAKNIYQLSKFGPDYKAFSTQSKSYLTCKVIKFPGRQMLFLETDGSVKVLDADASLLYSGNLIYYGEVPSGIALQGDKLWCCYKSQNILVRYNINNMREELRIGGGCDTPFNKPCDIYTDTNIGFICNEGSGTVLKVNLKTYDLEVYKKFDFPVKQYLKAFNSEFIVNKDGIYMI